MAYSDNYSAALTTLVDGLVAADKLEFSELLFSKAFQDTDVTQTHTVVTGIRKGHKVPILKDNPNYESFPFVDSTSCATTECDVANEFGNMEWDLALQECRVPICLRTFDEEFLRFFNQYKVTEAGEPDLNTAILAFITNKFRKNLVAAQWRSAYFADKSSASALFNGHDGFFTQAEANADQIVTVTQNDGAVTFADQKVTGEQVYGYLEAMYLKAGDQAWFDPSQVEFRIPRAWGVALVTFLNSKADVSMYNCDCINPNAITGARTFMLNGLRMFGIPVLVHQEWDGVINGTAELNGGGGTNPRVNPNRAILTWRNNLLIGTSEASALNSFDIFYDRKDRQVYLDGSIYMGSAIPMIDEYILAI